MKEPSRPACGGFYMKKIKYGKDLPTDRYLGFSYGLSDFNDHNYVIAMKRFNGGIKETKQGYGDQNPYFLARQYVYVGMCEQRLGEIRTAMEMYNLALQIDADLTHNNTKAALTRLGQCYASSGDYKSALAYYDQVLDPKFGGAYQSPDPMYSALNSDRAYYLRAVARLASGDREGAKQDCMLALQMRKQNYPKASTLLQDLNGGQKQNNYVGPGVTKVVEFGSNGQYSEQYYQQQVGGVIDFNPPARQSNQYSPSLFKPQPQADTPLSSERKAELKKIAKQQLREENIHELTIRELAEKFSSNDDTTSSKIAHDIEAVEEDTGIMAKNTMERAAKVFAGLSTVWSKVRGDFKDLVHFSKLMDRTIDDVAEGVIDVVNN